MDDFAGKKAEDWVIATGITTTVRDFVKMTFLHLGIEISFRGKALKKRVIFQNVTIINTSYQSENKFCL